MDPSQAPTEAPSGRIDPVDVPAPETAPPAALATPNECTTPPAEAEASTPEAPGLMVEEACVPTSRPHLVLEAHREAALVPPPPATRPPSQGPKGIRGSAAFVGVDRMKAAQHEELLRFRTYAAAGAWRKFHFNHYDWWLVPVHLPTPSQFGMMWAVCTSDIEALLSDAEYVENYREGVYLGALAWGIDLKTGTMVRSPGQSQSWTGHDVRLRKFGISLLLFRQYDLFEHLERFVQHLQRQGVRFQTESNMKRGRWPFRR